MPLSRIHLRTLRAWTFLALALIAAGGLFYGASHGARRSIHAGQDGPVRAVAPPGIPTPQGALR